MNSLIVPKWVQLLMHLYSTCPEQRYSQRIQHNMSITHAHLRKLLLILESKGLVYLKKTAKINYITLTTKGSRIAELLLRINQEVRIDEHTEKKEWLS